eukprot:7538794-Pyramimonas_sp.AAC.1
MVVESLGPLTHPSTQGALEQGLRRRAFASGYLRFVLRQITSNPSKAGSRGQTEPAEPRARGYRFRVLKLVIRTGLLLGFWGGDLPELPEVLLGCAEQRVDFLMRGPLEVRPAEDYRPNQLRGVVLGLGVLGVLLGVLGLLFSAASRGTRG